MLSVNRTATSTLRRARDAGAALLRSRVRPAVRQGIAHVEPLDRAATRVAQRRHTVQRLVDMYEQLRRTYADDVAAAEQPAGLPSEADVEAVEGEAVRAKMFDNFFLTLSADGDFDRAAITLTRRLIARRRRSRAMSIGQVFQRYDDLRPVADICLALCAIEHPMPQTAWTLLARNDLGLVLRWAPEEYFRLAFTREPETAAAALQRVLDGEVEMPDGAELWLDIAYRGFSAGSLELARQSLHQAETRMGAVRDRERRRHFRARLSTLEEWLDRAALAGPDAPAVEKPAGEIPIAVVGVKHPDWRAMSTDSDDVVDTLAALGHLLRHDGVQLRGESELVSAAQRLRDDAPAGRRIAGGTGKTVRLYEVERDLSRFAAVPDGTWMIVSEWFRHSLAGHRRDMPLHPSLRPIFISFHITPGELSAPGVADYLRKHAPIGCRDRDSVYLLHAAGVPAFFSGVLAMTIDNVVAPLATGAAATSTTLFVDAAPDGSGGRRTRVSPAIRTRELGYNLVEAAERLGDFRDSGARMICSDVRFYAAVRALGAAAELQPNRPGLYRFADYRDLRDADFAALQRGTSDKLAGVLAAVLAGRPEAEVYETWRELCAADVAQAEAELKSITGYPKLNFDIDEVCNVIRSASVTIERSRPARAKGAEVNVEFSLDGNYKHQLDIVLDSVVEHTSRPVRAFVLCRGHEQADFDRMARLFPMVSFVWLPTDDVNYGRIGGMNSWVTPATMDRTIMPVLLPEVDRIIHFDLDALCLSDLAELFDVDMEGTAIAGATTPQPSFLSGFGTFRRNAERLRAEGRWDLARELIIRTHSEHEFDFGVFNAGIMLLDLDKMRADDFCGRILPYVQRFGLNGQVVLNTYVGRHRKVVSNAWNRLIRLEADGLPRNACHWVGEFKPWRSDVYTRGRELWRGQEERFAARTQELETAAATAG